MYQLVYAGAGARVDSAVCMVQVPTVFVSHLNTMYPDHGQSVCYLFCEYRQQQYAPYNIGSNNRANTFISKCFH